MWTQVVCFGGVPVIFSSVPSCFVSNAFDLWSAVVLLFVWLGVGVLGSAPSVPGVSIQPSSGERLHRPTVRRPSSQGEEAGSLLRRWKG
jgi:hypothetical protein